MAQVKKVPVRRCLGCGEGFPKKELLRVLRDPDGAVTLDFTGKKSGRGAYVCRNLSCFRKARKAGRFASSLEAEIPDEVMDILEEEIRRFGESAPSADA